MCVSIVAYVPSHMSRDQKSTFGVNSLPPSTVGSKDQTQVGHQICAIRAFTHRAILSDHFLSLIHISWDTACFLNLQTMSHSFLKSGALSQQQNRNNTVSKLYSEEN